jgi:lactoylglutathione lyase
MHPQNMSLRMELFVSDLDRSIAFYRDVLGFELARRDPGYASIRHGEVQLGLGPIAKLPESGGHFTQERLAANRGMGVEIVLEVDDIQHVLEHVQAMAYPVFEPLQERPWGLVDFRIVDPDGYYLRLSSRA